MADNVLVIRNAEKHFGGTFALRGVSLEIKRGDVHAVVGANGAGKSTLMHLIAGVINERQFRGDLILEGQSVSFRGIADAEHHGIFLVPQELCVVSEMSVAENLFLNREPSRLGVVDRATLLVETARRLRSFGLDVPPTTPMWRLSVGEQQLVIIARAMLRGVKILILDEPTASLTETETRVLFERIADLHQHGITTLYISHRLAEIARIADRISVMRNGEIVDELPGRAASTTPHRIATSMIGREVEALYPDRVAHEGAVALEVENLRVTSAGRVAPFVDGVSFSLRRGEIVGMFGTIGSGTEQLVRALFGSAAGSVCGTIKIDGRPISLRAPADAIAHGIAFLPGERQESSVSSMSVLMNASLAALGGLSRFGLIDRAAEMSTVQKLLRRLQVKYGSVDQSIAQLSGGNQQKVLVSRWLAVDPRVLILEEPTRGVDVGARADLYALIDELAQTGLAILLVSSDLEEVLGMSDRVIVVHDGRVALSAGRKETSEELVLSAATSGAYA
jgi:ABC-type sugar transport system ATPase subunit